MMGLPRIITVSRDQRGNLRAELRIGQKLVAANKAPTFRREYRDNQIALFAYVSQGWLWGDKLVIGQGVAVIDIGDDIAILTAEWSEEESA